MKVCKGVHLSPCAPTWRLSPLTRARLVCCLVAGCCVERLWRSSEALCALRSSRQPLARTEQQRLCTLVQGAGRIGEERNAPARASLVPRAAHNAESCEGKSVNLGKSPGLSFTHLSASMAVVGVRRELVQATEARSAARTCARWLAGRLPAASSIALELDSTKSTCSPSVSSSRRLLPMVIRPGIGLVKLRRGVETASRRGTGHAAAPPAGPTVHLVGLSQLR